MADNSQLDFRLKIYVLELSSQVPTTITSPSPSSSPSPQQPTSAMTAASMNSTVLATANVTDYVIQRTIDTFEISRNDIEYRAEGNANIVLSIPQRHQVLRLPKKSESEQNICRSTAKECWRNERIWYVFKYIDRVSTLFGPNTSNRPILVRIEFCNVDAFDVWLHTKRPLHRIHHKSDDFDFDYGLLYHDACSLNLSLQSSKAIRSSGDDVFAVEIKPKQGWNICTLPEWLLELFEISHGLRNKCRFCAMQHLKVKGRQVHQLSKYCPLDLFSNNVPRMKKSIRNLIASPQNNFRVFRNGNLVYSNEYQEHELQSSLYPYFRNNSKPMDDFISLLINILKYDFVHKVDTKFQTFQVESQELIMDIATTATNGTSHSTRLNAVQQLPRRSILKRVLDLQLLVKKSISHVAQKYIDDSNDWKDLLQNQHWPLLHVMDLCRKLGQTDQHSIDVIDYEYLKTICKLNDEEIYEIGATALDSSIMLTFCCINEPSNYNTGQPLVKLNGEHFVINATIFDLDPKLYPRHFSKYVRKTRDSFNAYKSFSDAKTM